MHPCGSDLGVVLPAKKRLQLTQLCLVMGTWLSQQKERLSHSKNMLFLKHRKHRAYDWIRWNKEINKLKCLVGWFNATAFLQQVLLNSQATFNVSLLFLKLISDWKQDRTAVLLSFEIKNTSNNSELHIFCLNQTVSQSLIPWPWMCARKTRWNKAIN